MKKNSAIRQRIKGHRRVRAGDLVPHELNWRTHPVAQRAALEALYSEVGFARSLLAFETADGKLKLIDGHLRRDIDPDMLVEVEILDVTEEEAKKLLLAMDPLAALAGSHADVLSKLHKQVETDSEELKKLFDSLLPPPPAARPPVEPLPPQFLILIDCTDETQQTTLLEKLQSEGLKCRALLG